MGNMTLLNFQDDLKTALGRPDADAERLKRWINNAMAEFAYAFKFPELQKVAVINLLQGVNAYAMPNDFRSVTEDGVRIISPQNRFRGLLVAESRTNYLRSDRYPMTSTQGVVGAYHMFQKKIWVRPAPDGTATTIEFDYWAKVTPLISLTDTSVFDDDWDDVIFRGALYRGHLSYGEHDRMINVYNLFLGQIRSRVLADDLQEFPEGGISALESQYADIRR